MTTERAAADAPLNAEEGGLSVRGDFKTYSTALTWRILPQTWQNLKPHDGVISPSALKEDDARVIPFSCRALPAPWSIAL